MAIKCKNRNNIPNYVGDLCLTKKTTPKSLVTYVSSIHNKFEGGMLYIQENCWERIKGGGMDRGLRV